jgi:copper chaperone CopZ
MNTATIKTTGMHCPSCSMLIEMDVADLPGVESVKASVVDGTTVVTFDPSQIDIDAIADQIRKDGYGADIVG